MFLASHYCQRILEVKNREFFTISQILTKKVGFFSFSKTLILFKALRFYRRNTTIKPMKGMTLWSLFIGLLIPPLHAAGPERNPLDTNLKALDWITLVAGTTLGAGAPLLCRVKTLKDQVSPAKSTPSPGGDLKIHDESFFSKKLLKTLDSSFQSVQKVLDNAIATPVNYLPSGSLYANSAAATVYLLSTIHTFAQYRQKVHRKITALRENPPLDEFEYWKAQKEITEAQEAELHNKIKWNKIAMYSFVSAGGLATVELLAEVLTAQMEKLSGKPKVRFDMVCDEKKVAFYAPLSPQDISFSQGLRELFFIPQAHAIELSGILGMSISTLAPVLVKKLFSSQKKKLNGAESKELQQIQTLTKKITSGLRKVMKTTQSRSYGRIATYSAFSALAGTLLKTSKNTLEKVEQRKKQIENFMNTLKGERSGGIDQSSQYDPYDENTVVARSDQHYSSQASPLHPCLDEALYLQDCNQTGLRISPTQIPKPELSYVEFPINLSHSLGILTSTAQRVKVNDFSDGEIIGSNLINAAMAYKENEKSTLENTIKSYSKKSDLGLKKLSDAVLEEIQGIAQKNAQQYAPQLLNKNSGAKALASGTTSSPSKASSQKSISNPRMGKTKAISLKNTKKTPANLSFQDQPAPKAIAQKTSGFLNKIKGVKTQDIYLENNTSLFKILSTRYLKNYDDFFESTQ